MVFARLLEPKKQLNGNYERILIAKFCEISCFLKTTAKKLGDQYIVGPPI